MENKQNKKAIVLFSGGLDSRLTAKLLEDQGFEIHLAFIKLPFGGGCCNNLPCVMNFAQTNGFQLHIIDSTKDKNYSEYLNIIKNPKYGYGTSMNPCKDCKIFIFKKGKKLMEEINGDLLATGEVVNQRPMSQKRKILLLNDEMAGLKKKILRPLSAKILPETEYEKKGLINREKLMDIHGRQRQKQINLAEKYKIKYPNPAGGCLLCEKEYGKRLKTLLSYNKNPLFEETLFLKRGRMFKDKGFLFVGRSEEENLFIEKIAKKINWNIFKEESPGPTIIYNKKEDYNLAKKLRNVYSNKDLKLREEYSKYKI
jgi:tRNA U34 2-thiouridine synthase MnmA/TrmU